MVRVFLSLLVLLTPAFADAATFTSKATGDWSATGQTTWNETGSPGAADTVTINSGHVVDYDADFTHTGTITVNDGGTLRGDGARVLTLNNVALTVNAGGSITNTGGVFEIKIGSAANQANAAFVCGASSGNRATITGESSTNHIKFTDGSFQRGGKANVQRTDHSNVGTVASVPAYDFYPSTTDTFRWLECTFDAGCGKIDNTIALHSGTVFKFDDNIHLSTSQVMGVSLANSAIGSGTRSIQRNWIAGSLGNSGSGGRWQDVLVKHNVLKGQMYNTDSSDYPWDSGSGFNLIQSSGSGSFVVKATTTTSLPWMLHIHNPSATINDCRGLAPTVSRDLTVSGWIVEPGDTDSSGEIMLTPVPTSARVWSVTNNLILPNKDDIDAGQFIASYANANVTYASIAHNTYPASTPNSVSGAVSYGDLYAGHSGMIGEIKSNLVWDHTAGGGYVFQRRSLGTVADGCSSGNITHNGKWNLSTGDYGVGYDDTAGTGMFSSGSPGTSDVVVSADPFVDRTRRLSTWAVVRGYSVAGDYATQCADAYVALQTNTATRLEDLMTFIKEGWSVSDPALNGTAHDAGDIGAMDYLATAPVITTSATQMMEESERLVCQLEATGGTEPFVWTVTGGADAARFSVVDVSGDPWLRREDSDDFENPRDADTDGVAVVEVTCTDDATETDTLTINVTTTNEGGGGGVVNPLKSPALR